MMIIIYAPPRSTNITIFSLNSQKPIGNFVISLNMAVYLAAYSAIGISIFSFMLCVYFLSNLTYKIGLINNELEQEIGEFRHMEIHIWYIYAIKSGLLSYIYCYLL